MPHLGMGNIDVSFFFYFFIVMTDSKIVLCSIELTTQAPLLATRQPPMKVIYGMLYYNLCTCGRRLHH
jgi:hypothetical protein